MRVYARVTVTIVSIARVVTSGILRISLVNCKVSTLSNKSNN